MAASKSPLMTLSRDHACGLACAQDKCGVCCAIHRKAQHPMMHVNCHCPVATRLRLLCNASPFHKLPFHPEVSVQPLHSAWFMCRIDPAASSRLAVREPTTQSILSDLMACAAV